MKRKGFKCKCLRCREIGHQQKISNFQFPISNKISKSKFSPYGGSPAGRQIPKLFIDKYAASGGTEYFLSFEDKKREAVYAFLRLRLPKMSALNGVGEAKGERGVKTASIIPELKNAALIRELHTYGHLAPIGKSGEVQHSGFGKKLMEQAEEIAQKAGFRKAAVISGIGVREYYRKLGYKLEGTYMVKQI